VHALQAERRAALILRRDSPIWIRVLLVAWLVWLLDVGSKAWALATLENQEPRKILGDFLTLTLAKNSGAAFSFATSGAVLLASFSILVVCAIGFWARRLTSLPWAYVFGLVLGGSLGNLSDRIFRASPQRGAFRGQVIDWIELPHWPIFNLADAAIVIAAVLSAVLSIRNIAPISPSSPTDQERRDDGPHGT